MNRISRVLIVALAFLVGASAMEAKTKVTKESFGKLPDGTAIDIYTLSDGPVEARITNYGGVLVSFKVPDKSGKSEDVVLGFDSADGYYQHFNHPNNAFFGAVIGRYANRIAHGSFTLDGKKYELPKNDGPNTLHSGPHGFNNVVWTGKQIPNGVELTYLAKDGESGFPGNLTTTVRYTLLKTDLRIEYAATTDKDTVLNLTNHSYFNLAGQGNGDILKHQLALRASRYTPVNATLIPTGELAPVASTPLDFTKPAVIGERIDADNDQLKKGRGYDHNWVLDSKGGKLAEAAEVYEPTSGRVLKVFTTEPGVQFYSGNFLDGTVKGKQGKTYLHRGGFCLETQHFPDSPNQPNFPSTELKPGQKFNSVTVFSFSTR
jgi:aldose 1-epimerase